MKYQTFFAQGTETCTSCKASVYTLVLGLCRKCIEKTSK